MLTLLFTDVERSTEIIDRFGDRGTEALMRHHEIVRDAVARRSGRLFERIGDATYSVFDVPLDGVETAIEVHERLAAEDWGEVRQLRVRIALDTGELEERDGRFLGRALYRCARIQSMAKGGETLISGETAAHVAERLPQAYRLRDLGQQKLRGLGTGARVWGLVQVQSEGPGEEPTIRVLLVDDYEVVRRGLRGFLELVPGFEIVGEAGNGREALDAAYRLQPDVVLMDLVMPEMDGPTAIAELKQRQPEVAVIALTSFAEPERIARAIAAGAAGHLMKDAQPDEVAAAVREAHAARRDATPAG